MRMAFHFTWASWFQAHDCIRARHVPIPRTVPGLSKRNGDRLTVQFFDLVCSFIAFSNKSTTHGVIGPCQPSMVYRYLRMLEGVSPPLSLTQLSCQTTAKAFIVTRTYSAMQYNFTLILSSFTMTVFDRMFSLGVRGSGTDTAPLGVRVTAVAGAAAGPRRHFLYCSLKPEAPRNKRSRELL